MFLFVNEEAFIHAAMQPWATHSIASLLEVMMKIYAFIFAIHFLILTMRQELE